MKISWIILTNTMDGPGIVNKCFKHNSGGFGGFKGELIWVDNGIFGKDEDISELTGYELLSAGYQNVNILNRTNLGVAKGYNRGYAMATGTHVMITGCDRMMPIGFMDKFMDCFEAIPNTGIISVYSKPISQVPDRTDGKVQTINGHDIIECLPFEARILSRDLFKKIGYLREDFGLYGYEDIEWASRAQRVTKELGLINYTFPDYVAEHMGIEGGGEFKQKELADPKKKEVWDKCVKENFPYYNPFI